MKIAIPLDKNELAMHFGHCECFTFIDVNPDDISTIKREDIEAPPHAPGLLPPWLIERGAELVIAGGMGQKAINMFEQQGIEVIVGAPIESPEKLVADYLAGSLIAGNNICDH
jgi:predicted Fe-Mo cluster-binding NifX family protein